MPLETTNLYLHPFGVIFDLVPRSCRIAIYILHKNIVFGWACRLKLKQFPKGNIAWYKSAFNTFRNKPRRHVHDIWHHKSWDGGNLCSDPAISSKTDASLQSLSPCQIHTANVAAVRGLVWLCRNLIALGRMLSNMVGPFSPQHTTIGPTDAYHSPPHCCFLARCLCLHDRTASNPFRFGCWPAAGHEKLLGDTPTPTGAF